MPGAGARDTPIRAPPGAPGAPAPKVAAPTPEGREELRGLLVSLAQERGFLAADPNAAEEVPAMRERLLRYCERDTEATAGILQALRDMVIIQDSG